MPDTYQSKYTLPTSAQVTKEQSSNSYKQLKAIHEAIKHLTANMEKTKTTLLVLNDENAEKLAQWAEDYAKIMNTFTSFVEELKKDLSKVTANREYVEEIDKIVFEIMHEDAGKRLDAHFYNALIEQQYDAIKEQLNGAKDQEIWSDLIKRYYKGLDNQAQWQFAECIITIPFILIYEIIKLTVFVAHGIINSLSNLINIHQLKAQKDCLKAEAYAYIQANPAETLKQNLFDIAQVLRKHSLFSHIEKKIETPCENMAANNGLYAAEEDLDAKIPRIQF